MEKEFVPYELALRMKALGFDEPCFGIFMKEKLCNYASPLGIANSDSITALTTSYSDLIPQAQKDWVVAPLYQQAFRWFREKYGLWFRPDYYDEMKEYNFQGSIHKLGKYSAISDIGNHKTPEDAELACLEKLIEIVEEKEK
jgi:hypothetical protein